MRSVWLSRLFFAVVGATAVAGIISGTACTRWGQPGPIVPTLAPLASIYVDPINGSDTSGSGSASNPYKTMTKAVAVLTAAKSIAQGGVTIFLASGNYDAANGEKFPIVVSRSVTITGTNYGTGPATGSFIDGLGEDTIFESVVHAPARSAYATFEVVPPASVSLGGVYIGALKIKLPSSRAVYSSVDIIGALNASNASFGAGTTSELRNVNGVLVASGSLSCASCQIRGNDFGIGALTVPIATASPSTGVPSITLTHANGDSTIVAKIVDIVTDGSANVTASGEGFEKADYAFEDSLAPIVPVATRGAIDFGGGTTNSPGANDFIGARVTEISIGRRFETVSALDDTWNPSQQHANRNGLYTRKLTFGAGTSGRNVTIHSGASGSTVTVGPAPVPTPTPSTTPSGPPSPTPTPT
jgi:hypothetical protein